MGIWFRGTIRGGEEMVAGRVELDFYGGQGNADQLRQRGRRLIHKVAGRRLSVPYRSSDGRHCAGFRRRRATRRHRGARSEPPVQRSRIATSGTEASFAASGRIRVDLLMAESGSTYFAHSGNDQGFWNPLRIHRSEERRGGEEC